MKPATRSFCTSLMISASISGWKVHMGCITNFTPSSTLRAYTTKLRSKPGISLYSQAQTLAYSFKSAMSWVFSSCDKFALIEVVHRTLGSLLRLTTYNSISAGKDRLGAGNNSSHDSAMFSKECSTGAAVSIMLLRECFAGAAVS